MSSDQWAEVMRQIAEIEAQFKAKLKAELESRGFSTEEIEMYLNRVKTNVRVTEDHRLEFEFDIRIPKRRGDAAE